MDNIDNDYLAELDVPEAELGPVDDEECERFANEMTISDMIINDNIEVLKY